MSVHADKTSYENLYIFKTIHIHPHDVLPKVTFKVLVQLRVRQDGRD